MQDHLLQELREKGRGRRRVIQESNGNGQRVRRVECKLQKRLKHLLPPFDHRLVPFSLICMI